MTHLEMARDPLFEKLLPKDITNQGIFCDRQHRTPLPSSICLTLQGIQNGAGCSAIFVLLLWIGPNQGRFAPPVFN